MGYKRPAARAVPTLIGAAAVLMILASCTTEPTRETLMPSVRDSAGIRVVEYTGPLSGRAVELEPIFDYGHSADQYTFQVVSKGALQPDGSAVVADAGSSEVLHLDPNGTRATVLAGKGRGPGEVLRVASIHVAGQDTVWIEDDGNAKVLLLEAGTLARTVNLPGFELSYGLSIEGLDSSGDFLMRTGAFRPGSSEGWLMGSLVRLDPDQLSADTVGTFPLAPPPPSGPENPFSTAGVISGAGPAFVHAQMDQPKLVWRSADGTVTQIVRWVTDPEYPSEGDWESFKTSMRDDLRRVNRTMGQDQMAAFLDEQVARYEWDPAVPLPIIAQIVGDDRGGVWVARYEPADLPRSREYDVFSPSGEWAGTASFAEPVLILDVLGDRVLVVTRDSMDVQGIAELRVRAGSADRR